MVIKEDTRSLPGSLIDQSPSAGEQMNASPVVCAEDGYRSQGSEDFGEVKVVDIEEQGKADVVEEAPKASEVAKRRDPEEEFFMLAVLALKMQYTENQEGDFIYQIDSSKLFEQVKQIKLPFHKWYAWIDTKFSMMKVAFEQEQEDLYNDPCKNPAGLVNPYKKE